MESVKIAASPVQSTFPFQSPQASQPASKLGETDLLFGSGPRCIIRATLHRHRHSSHRLPPNTLHSPSHMRTRIGRQGAKRGLVLRSLARSFVRFAPSPAGRLLLALLSALLSLDNTNLRPRPSPRPRPLARSDARLRRWELRGEEGVKALSPSLRH